eukprot:maker-scaffold_39-snap-gene-1.3-mRNA-1 protein AED:0.26 eAED:0.26 QI:136/1/1/1/1/1/3/87/234
MKKLILLGAPGAGKGTYSNLLASNYNLCVLSVGDVIRAEIKKETDIGKQFKQYNNSGKLVPDKLVINLVQKELETLPKNFSGIIFDGFPRTIPQAKALENFLKLDHVLNLNMESEYLIDKILGRRICSNPTCKKSFNVTHVRNKERGVDMPPLLPKNGSKSQCDCGSVLVKRADDVLDVVQNRLRVYEKQTMPLLDFYESKGLLKTVNIKKGLGDFPKIVEKLGMKTKTRTSRL